MPSDTKTDAKAADAKQEDKTQPQKDSLSGVRPDDKRGAMIADKPIPPVTSADDQKKAALTKNEKTVAEATRRTTAAAERDLDEHELRPGDVGYAPPARLANTTGVLTNADLGYHPGSDASVNVHGQIPLAMPAPADPSATSLSSAIKPSLLNKASATLAFAKMTGELQAWIMDSPHEMNGRLAVIAQFFRDLQARQLALGTAEQLGRTVAPDAVDKAVSTAPPEYFELRQAAGAMMTLAEIYQEQMDKLGLELPAENQKTVDSITAKYADLAKGPTKPVPADAA